MQTARISDIFKEPPSFNNAPVVLEGWVRTVRDSKAFAFIELNDGSTVLSVQLVLDENTAGFEMARKLNVASAVRAVGNVVLTPEAKQPFEIKASEVVLLGASSPEYPLQKKRHTFEYLRTIAHLRPRSNTFNAVFRVRSEAAFAIHEFFNQRGFVYAHTPIITGSDAEGAGEMFRVTTLPPVAPLTESGEADYAQDFFGKETNLTVTGQMQAETFALAFKNTYTFGPTFRAEHSNTARHAAEFWMVEPEMAFCDLAGDMDIAEAMVKHIIRHVLDKCPNEMAFFEKFIEPTVITRLTSIVDTDFARLPYTDAIEELLKVKDRFEYPVFWGCDLQTEHERYITEELMKGRPTFITNYPKEIKAFYMRLNDDGKTVAATDLMVPGIGELIGGSQREERYDMLKQRIEELDMDMKNYWWYLELRKYGGVTCSGFGIGFERLIMYLTGMTNIRDVVPYPRTLGTAEF